MQTYGARLVKILDRAVQEAEARKKGRTHLGASILGRKCLRQVWYDWRWMHITKHQGRLLRLFARGQREEAALAFYLVQAGLIVKAGPAPGQQFTFADHDGHFGGSSDGIIAGVNIPLPDFNLEGPGLAEYKTHGEKSFAELAGKLEDYRKYVTDPVNVKFPGKGVLTAKVEHYVQMQIYMHYFGLKWALYVAVCKNTDDLYLEFIQYKPELAQAYIDRARQIIYAQHPPTRISNDPSWWECRFCDFREICHRAATPAQNCRSCIYAAPGPAGTWHCSKFHGDIPADFVPKGCGQWDPILT
jgi:hypothetical protein